VTLILVAFGIIVFIQSREITALENEVKRQARILALLTEANYVKE
jgi:hypothetical protein